MLLVLQILNSGLDYDHHLALHGHMNNGVEFIDQSIKQSQFKLLFLQDVIICSISTHKRCLPVYSKQ